MLKISHLWAVFLFCSSIAGQVGGADQEYAKDGAQKCLSCHDFGWESPVHNMLAGAHGKIDNEKTPMRQRGCEDCHGPSANHTRAPTQVSPAVSFGPRWSASIADQDQQCVACHEDNAAKHWRDALHMVNNLTCVTCHDVHKENDKVLQTSGQSEVCTVCHKAQKSGIHGLPEHKKKNPACTSCHNPHDGSSTVTSMVENRSQGCSSCHDLVAMNSSATSSEKSKSYHKVMGQKDRSCLDCHQDIAHRNAIGVAANITTATNTRNVTLFDPGNSHSEWLLSEHPGSQPLRQGRNCQQCHRGDERDMAAAISSGSKTELREVTVAISKDADNIKLSLKWKGPENDADIALMWGNNDSDDFRRGGCFAACHSDMPGMDKDKGQQQGKYLFASRTQQQLIGQPALPKDQKELDRMIADGNFVEMWRLKLNGGNASVETATLLSGLNWREGGLLKGSASYASGYWTVDLRRPLLAGSGYKDFIPQEKYTLGIAIHGDKNPGGQHWVSLPMTLRLVRGPMGDDTDFTVE
jgi:predicted CXXCH cytochrome family protein